MLRSLENKLNLRWKIYIALSAIVFPVLALTVILQTQVVRPLLEEEIRQIGLSTCRSLATEIAAFRLLSKPKKLESRLIEATWQQPSVARLDVIVREGENIKLIASNVVDPDLSEDDEEDQNEGPINFARLVFDEIPTAEIRHEDDRSYWEVVYPIKDERRVIGYLHAEVSLQLANQIVGLFSKIALGASLLSLALLIGLLSYYLRRMIENERRLRIAESENVALVNELQETQRQLFLNEKLAIMGQLTASFAHEIGTPLNSLSGHLQLLSDELKQKDAHERIDIIQSQVARIEGIVKEFLASTHTPHQQKQLVNPATLVSRISKLVTPRLQNLGGKAEVRIEGEIEPIRAVPTDLEQVLLNLANNAIDALEGSAQDKILRFNARTYLDSGNRKQLELAVIDTGPGMPPEVIKQVLKPFFTTKAPGQGTGLGLTISQRLVKKYGGRLEIQSALGKGSTITVTLPYDSA